MVPVVCAIFVIAIVFARSMIKRDAIKRGNEHERRIERFDRLLEQLKKSKNEPGTGSEKKEREVE
jgi:hypothetical protein